MNGKKIFQKERAYLIEAKNALENGDEIDLRKALADIIYSCEEAITMATITMKINDDLVKELK